MTGKKIALGIGLFFVGVQTLGLLLDRPDAKKPEAILLNFGIGGALIFVGISK